MTVVVLGMLNSKSYVIYSEEAYLPGLNFADEHHHPITYWEGVETYICLYPPPPEKGVQSNSFSK
jgi:hypothetical protein